MRKDRIMQNNTSLIFVVDPPNLVIDAILLLASIRRHMPDIHVVGYCPAEKEDKLPPQLVEFFNANNASIEFMKTEGVFAPAYKQGNKLIAAQASRPTDFTLFLDTDTLVMRPFDPADILKRGEIAAAPEGRFTWGKDPDMWPSAYTIFGLDVPSARIALAKTNASSPPYFNAGVVGFANDTADGRRFADIWMDTALQIDADQQVRGRRPWLDQIALPVAMKRAGFGFTLLDKKWNLSMTHKRVDQADNNGKRRVFQKIIDDLNTADPIIAHYHNHSAMKDLAYSGLTDEILSQSTCFHSYDDIKSKMIGDAPRKGDIMPEFHTLKRIKDKTPEQKERFRVVDAMKRKFQSGEIQRQYYQDWPDSILPASVRR